MDDSHATVLGLAARFISIINDAIECGLSQDDVNTALTAAQQLVGQVGPSSQTKTGSQPGPVPRK